VSPPAKPPRPVVGGARLPERIDSDWPITEGDRVWLAGVIEGVEDRFDSKLDELSDRLAREVREQLSREREQDRAFGQSVGALDARVSALATQVGRDAGGDAGAAAARVVASGSGTRWTVIAMLVSALTAGVIQGMVKALEPVKASAPFRGP
jgi:hypothetical protein